MGETPFDNVDAAHDYVALLVEAVVQARAEVAQDLASAADDPASRERDALRLVAYKLERLETQLVASRRLLNDLRRLRRLLLGEVEPAARPRRGGDDDPWEDA
jgi:hypothetical protein